MVRTPVDAHRRRAHRRRRARLGSGGVGRPARRHRPRRPRAAAQQAVRARHRRALGGRGRPTTSTPASRPAGGTTATTCGTRRRRTRCSPAARGTSPTPLDLGAMTAGERARSSVSTTSARSAGACQAWTRASRSARGCARCMAGRRWTEAPWGVDDGRLLRFEIRANAFCHQMVRSIVGTLVDVGAGKYAARRRAGDPRRRATVTRPARWPRRTASPCGRSATRRRDAPGRDPP